MTRRQIRYWFFRFHAVAVGDDKSITTDDAPPGFSEEWEAHPYFGGWDKFGINWDLAPGSTSIIVPLRYSLESEWNREVSASARELPTANEG